MRMRGAAVDVVGAVPALAGAPEPLTDPEATAMLRVVDEARSSDPAWAEKFLKRWCFRTMRSNIEPMKDIAKMLRRHQELILNWFRAKKHFNNGIVEGLNLKWNLTVRKAFGFRTFNALKMASFHQLGDLPEPQFTHEFY